MAALLSAGIALRLYTNRNTVEGARAVRRDIADIQTDDSYDAQRKRQNALMDEYGSRDSLEELEKAVQFYQKRQ